MRAAQGTSTFEATSRQVRARRGNTFRKGLTPGRPRFVHGSIVDGGLPTGRVDKLSASSRKYGPVSLPIAWAAVAPSALSPEGTNTLPYLCIEGLSDSHARPETGEMVGQ